MDGEGDDQGDGVCRAAEPEKETLASLGDEDVGDTQPLLANENDSCSQELGIEYFGYLVALKPRGTTVGLMKDLRFSVGRGSDNSLVFKGNSQEIVNISKLHFVIGEDSELGGPWIMDHSCNGTFVNGQRLVKEAKKPLAHNDAIGMAHPFEANYLFVSALVGENKSRYPREVRSKYAMATELGKGAGGQVTLSVRRIDLAQIAMKIIDKEKLRLSPRAFWNEVRLLNVIDHPCVIRLEEAIDTDEKLYIALEFAEGGSLQRRISQAKEKCLGEYKAKLYFYQLLCAVEYLHSKGIAHRDLKPENILLSSEDEALEIVKVADLGLSKRYDEGSDLRTFCGSNYYLAPEVVTCLLGGGVVYSNKCDLWSLGVVLHEMLSGFVPFSDKDGEILRQIQEAKLSFPYEEWKNVNPDAIDLISKLINKDVGERLSATEALKHSWMADHGMIAEAKRRIRQAACSGSSAVAAMEPAISEPSTSKGISRGLHAPDKGICQRK